MEVIDYTDKNKFEMDIFTNGKKIELDDIPSHPLISECRDITPEILGILTSHVADGSFVCYEYMDALHFMPLKG